MTEKLKKMNKLQRDVFMLLPMGMDRLVSTTDIGNILNIDERYIRGIIEELIMEYEIPIGSSREKNHSGYFIATNLEEKIRGTYSLEQQAKAMDKRSAKVKSADVSITYQYKEKYKHDEPDYDKQLDLLETIEAEDINNEDTISSGGLT